MITTRLLSVEEILQKEQILSAMIMQALEKGQGERGLNDYAALVGSGEAQVWLVEDNDELLGVCLTKFIHYPNYKSLHIVALTGDGWNTWGPSAHETLEEFAKATECSKIEVWGRKGWERALKQISAYQHAYSVFSMEI